MSHDAGVLYVTLNLWSQAEWHQAAGKDSSEKRGNESKLESVALDVCTQAFAVLTAVFHYISVMCF